MCDTCNEKQKEINRLRAVLATERRTAEALKNYAEEVGKTDIKKKEAILFVLSELEY